MKAAYHHPRIAARVGLESRFALVRPWARRPQAAVMPAAWVAASRSLRVCDATRGTTPGISDTKCRDTKGEVDSKAEVNGR